MSAFDYDLRYLKAGIESLESYLLSDHLHYSLDTRAQSGEPAFPNLTLGNLLLSEARLRAWPKTLEQEGQLGALLPRLDQQRSRWRTAWGKKAVRSLHSRLNLWRDYLDEYRRTPDANADRYAFEVKRRVMIDLLQVEVDEPSRTDLELLARLDALLKTFLIRGKFIWSGELAGGFPTERYWYLYGWLPDELKLPDVY
jgi:hypothetical protein